MPPRVLLILPSATYRAADFIAAARSLGAEVVVACERRQTLEGAMGGRALRIGLADPAQAAAAIVSAAEALPLDAVIGVDDQGVLAAALAAERLGLRHAAPAAVAATRDKAAMRRLLAAAGVPQPEFRLAGSADQVAALFQTLGGPVVVKPVSLSASRGVIRADTAEQAAAAAARAERIAGGGPLLVERFTPGAEVAVEGLLSEGTLRVLAVFDKPDPLDGPYFEETIYVTPSRLAATRLARVHELTAAAAEAIGLHDGPVHAELRVEADDVRVIEIAARSIGGLCSRTLRFGLGIGLERLILCHALGLPLGDLRPARAAAGVMMIPIPRAGRLIAVDGQQRARALPEVEGLEITIPPGGELVPLPEGDRYLGFLFARGGDPATVERALRRAHDLLDVRVEAGRTGSPA